MAANLLGVWGEAAAAAYLRQKGYAVVATNFRCRVGEIDIVAQKGHFLAFVEVKLRKNNTFAEAREAVDARKQNRLRKTAGLYLAIHPTELQPRFDVIEIYAPEGSATRKPVINHLEDAFT